MNLIRKLTVVIVALAGASVAQADPIVHLFNGEIVRVEYSGADPVGGSIVEGTSFFGGYIFDSDAQPPGGPTACDIGPQCTWEFAVPPYQLIFSIGGILGAATGPELAIQLTNNSVSIGGFAGDQITVSSQDNGAIFGGLANSVAQIVFTDLTGAAFDDPSILPIVAPDLDLFTLRPFPEFLPAQIAVFGDWGDIRGEITWIQEFPRQVPEPGTLALLGIGLFGMGLARRKKKA